MFSSHNLAHKAWLTFFSVTQEPMICVWKQYSSSLMYLSGHTIHTLLIKEKIKQPLHFLKDFFYADLAHTRRISFIHKPPYILINTKHPRNIIKKMLQRWHIRNNSPMSFAVSITNFIKKSWKTCYRVKSAEEVRLVGVVVYL